MREAVVAMADSTYGVQGSTGVVSSRQVMFSDFLNDAVPRRSRGLKNHLHSVSAWGGHRDPPRIFIGLKHSRSIF